MGGAETTRDCSGCKAPFVNTFSCKSTSATLVVGISESLAITVVCLQATQLPPSINASRSAAALILSLLEDMNLLLLLRNRRILQSELLTRLQALSDQRLVAALLRYLNRRLLKFRSVPHVRHRSSRFPKERIRRNHNSVRHARYRDAHCRSHSRRQPRIAPHQSQFHRKISRHRPACAEIQARRRTNRVYASIEATIRQRIQPHARRLSQFQLPPLRFFHARRNLQRRTVRQLRNRRSRPRAVARLKSRRAPLRLPVILQCHHAIQRRP